MILLILAAIGFYRGAEKRNMIGWLWAVIGVASYFTGPFLAGIIIGLTDPYTLYDEGTLNIYGIISAIASLIVAYIILVIVGDRKQKKKEKQDEDSTLLDDQF
jgi:hypothetical protein